MIKRVFYHQNKYRYVKVREIEPNSKTQCVCEVSESNETVVLSKNELTSSILVNLKVVSMKENAEDSYLQMTLEINLPIIQQVSDMMDAGIMKPFNFDQLIFKGLEITEA